MIEVEVTPISTRGKKICVVYFTLFCMAETAIGAIIAVAGKRMKISIAAVLRNANRVRGMLRRICREYAQLLRRAEKSELRVRLLFQPLLQRVRASRWRLRVR